MKARTEPWLREGGLGNGKRHTSDQFEVPRERESQTEVQSPMGRINRETEGEWF